jgi:hypothetical protein
MGSRDLDKFVLDLILETGAESVSLIGPNERTWLVKQLSGVGIEVDVIDSDPKFENPRDVIFDDVELKELAVVFNAEKHYPVGKKFKDQSIIVIGDDEQHNGDCNPITSCDQLIVQNNLTVWYSRFTTESHYIVYGHSDAS